VLDRVSRRCREQGIARPGAAQPFTMVLVVDIGKSFVEQYDSAVNAGIRLKAQVVMMVGANV